MPGLCRPAWRRQCGDSSRFKGRLRYELTLSVSGLDISPGGFTGSFHRDILSAVERVMERKRNDDEQSSEN